MMKMKKMLLLTAALLLTASSTTLTAQTLAQWPEAQPEAKAGARWWWMGSAIDAGSLAQTIGEYAQCGIGSLEVTPIYGVQGNEKNELVYLSSAWMNALKAAQTAGDAAGVDIDMNGGTGWPFGGPWVKLGEAAGKLVTKTDVLTSDGTTALSWSVAAPEGNATLNRVLAYSTAALSGEGSATDVTEHVSGQTLTWAAPDGEWRLIAVYDGHTLQQVKRAAPGGEGYVLDHYDSLAVAHYLEHFDEAFAQHGGRWPRSFFNDSYEVYGADWTPRFFEEFLKYRGYRLEDYLPQLLGLATDKDYQVLADYRQTLSDMLLNNFTRQWTRWAHGHGVTTRNQGHGSPGNLLDFYAAVDIPEIEGFGLTDFRIRGLRTDPGFVRQNLSDFSTLKYASSAAHVMGKPLTSSETFTWLTEHFRTSLSQMKPDLDLMFVAGVNHMFFHGTTYTPPSAPWPGWKFYASIDMSPTNSIWHDAPALMQYIERCQSFLQMGSPDNDLLVYAPFLDAMHRTTTQRLLLFDINTLSQKMSELTTCVQHVEQAGLDCDYVSDQQLLSVTLTDGLLCTEGGTRYKALVVPASKYMPAEVKAHLDALQAQGAHIVWGNQADQLAETGAQPEALRTMLGLRVLRRQNATGHHYFIANLSDRDVEGWVPLSVAFQSAVFFQPLDGTMADALVDGDGKVYISLRSGESVILQTYAEATSCGNSRQPSQPMASRRLAGPCMLQLGDEQFVLNELSGWQSLSSAAQAFMGTGTYETTFNADADWLAIGDAGFRLEMGDVRESARLWLNGEPLGTVWSAPFTADCPPGLIHEGENTLRIEVTNLPANRIRQMDIDGQPWRIFKDVNILDIVNGSEGSSGVISYASWSLVPSGLCSDVMLTPLHRADRSLSVEMVSFSEEDGEAFPVYRLAAPADIVALTAVTEQGSAYEGFTARLDGRNAYVTMKQAAAGHIHFTATDAAGQRYDAYLLAMGSYEPVGSYDFTSSEPPLCGWNKTADALISGFEGTGTVERYTAKKSGKVVTELYDGLTFSSEKSNNFYFYPTYGMAPRLACEVQFAAEQGTIAMTSYLRGSGDASSVYRAEDSLTVFTQCADAEKGITLQLGANSDFYIYRHLGVYKPKAGQSSIGDMTAGAAVLRPTDTDMNDLQGRRLKPSALKKGIYIYRGKKIVRK